jgi:peptidyl-prolyl cis-trans isomerase D
MSFISAIRQRSGLVVGVVAISLVLFILTSIVSDPSFSFFSNEQSVGEINGESISAKVFGQEIEKLENDFQIQNNRGPNDQERQQLRDQAWNNLLFQKLYKAETQKLGMAVTEEEVIDMVQGNNIHPSLKQAFTNPVTGQFEKAKVKEFLANINKMEPKQQVAWLSFENKLPDDRLRNKYEALLSKTEYVTSVQAKMEYMYGQEKADVQYLFVNYANIPDSTIKPTDEELAAFLKENQYRYKTQENRGIEYVSFPLTPSAEDSAAIRAELDKIKTDFGTATDDTLFAASHSDAATKLQTLGVNELPQDLSPIAGSLEKGLVYGPYLSGSTYTLYKVVSIGAEGASNAKASHILFKSEPSSPDTAKAAAKKKAQDILNKIKAGANFEEMARMYGSDGTKDQGGDLGWFDETRMVKPFADAVFGFSGTGLLPNLVQTDFGYHIVKVTGAKTNIKYKVVTIQKTISAGDKTSDAIYAKATAFKQAAQDKASFTKAIADQKLALEAATNLTKNGNGFNNVSEARQVVVWAYGDETKVGSISTVFELSDRYLVAILTKSTEEGPASVEDVRDAITNEVRKQKKAEQIIAKLGKGTLEQMRDKNVAGAVLNTSNDVLFSSMALGDLGYDPEAVGRLFGLKVGQVLPPTKGETGVYAFKLLKHTDAPKLDPKTDLATYKQTVAGRTQGRAQYYIGEALKAIGKVKDQRVRFF